ncbi:MAG: MarR family transcriptional regulator [Pirellulales bacterium]
MLRHDFEQSVGHWLMLAAKDYERALNAAIVPSGITWRQVQVLGWLAYEEQLTQAELAERMAIEPPTLVGILDRMERDGWICRHDCPTDRRKKIIRPTAQAEPAWEKILSCAQGMRADATEGLTEAERLTLIDLLRRVRRNLTDEATHPLPPTAKTSRGDTVASPSGVRS